MTHSRRHKPVGPGERFIVQSMDEVPDFDDECGEVDYWETHEPAAGLFKPGAWNPV